MTLDLDIGRYPHQLRKAAALATRHGLTLYDASYAAVAQVRGAQLATLDEALLRSGLEHRPSTIIAALEPETDVPDDPDLAAG